MASREFFASETKIALSPKTFTVIVMKLKVLGKFLGLLQFYHMRSQLFLLWDSVTLPSVIICEGIGRLAIASSTEECATH
jgi:hypothetical protein